MTNGLIYSLIPKISKAIGSIEKAGTNAAQNYKFRGIEQFYKSAQPALIEHGVFCVPQVIDKTFEHYQSGDKIKFRVLLTVNHKFTASDGSFVEVITQGEGIDNSDKASNKAMSSAMKYAFIELFSIPTQDVADSDRDSPEIDSDWIKFQNQTKPTIKKGSDL